MLLASSNTPAPSSAKPPPLRLHLFSKGKRSQSPPGIVTKTVPSLPFPTTDTPTVSVPQSISQADQSTHHVPNFVRRRHYNRTSKINNCESQEPPEDDGFAAYRQLCETRMRRLERYKKTKSLCALNNEGCSNDPRFYANSNNLSRSDRTSSANYLHHYSQNAGQSRLTASCSHSNLHFYCSADRSALTRPTSSILVGEAGQADYSVLVDSETPPLSAAIPEEFPISMTCEESPSRHCEETSSISSADHASCRNHAEKPTNLQFEVLREKMISLMENDVQLLQKLLTLGETIHQLRRNNQNHSHNNSAPNRVRHSARIRLQKACSESSLSSPAEDDNPTDYDGQTSEDLESELKDEWRPLENGQPSVFSQSMSAITNLYVGETDEDDLKPNVQYFSRKNSVLRIPIPPRASNRMCGKKMLRRPSEFLRHGRNSVQPVSPSSNVPSSITNEDSGHSSNTPSSQCSPTNVPMTEEALRLDSETCDSALPAAGTCDSGRGCSSTDGGSSSRFSTFSSISSASSVANQSKSCHASMDQTNDASQEVGIDKHQVSDIERDRITKHVTATSGEPHWSSVMHSSKR
ncbi:hypothetical protein Ddc_04924 [Ditylenchus destructor]|nr:hypothetical protein Ddc_04924 [Ditylenchus destructor]